MPRKDISNEAAKGGLSKKSKEAAEELKSLAKAFGLSESEAFVQAVELFKQAKLLEGLDPKCFLAGYNFAIQMMRQNLYVLMAMSKLMVSEYIISQIDLLDALDRMRSEIIAKSAEAPEQKVSASEQLKAMLMPQLMNMLLNMLGNMGGPLGNALKALSPALSGAGSAVTAASAGASSSPVVEE